MSAFRLAVRTLPFAALALLLAVEIYAADPAPSIENVHITYNWRGLGQPRDEVYAVVRDGKEFKASVVVTNGSFGPSGSSATTERSTYTIPVAAIEALIEALRAPSMTKAEGVAALTEPSWLRVNAAAAYQSIVEHPCSDKARELFVARFEDSAAVRKVLDNYFIGMWTDDYPHAEIEGRLKEIGAFKRTTGSQKAFMVPWRSGVHDDWNPALGRSVAALLPETSDGKERLAGKQLLSELAYDVRRGIKDQWENMELRCTYRDLISKLEPHYKILSIYGTSNNFAGYVESSDMPANLAINIVLATDTPAIQQEEVDTLLNLGSIYASQVRAFVVAHPETRFTIWYSQRHSLDEGDLKFHERPELARLRPIARQCVMLYEHDYMYGRRWVVTPNGEVILWSERPTYDTRRPGPGW